MAVKFKGLGYVAVPSPGNSVPLAADQILSPGCVIRALPENTGAIYVGGVDLTTLTRGVVLGPGDAVEIVGPNIGGTEEEIDLAEVRIDADVAGEQVIVSYFTRRT